MEIESRQTRKEALKARLGDIARGKFRLPRHGGHRGLIAAAENDVAPWLAPAIVLAAHTGLREGKLLRLWWQDIDEKLQLATIPNTKNNTPKHIPLNSAARATMAALPRSGPCVLSWPWGDPVSNTTLHAAFKRACVAAEVRDFRCHDLRPFASHLVMAGVDLRTVQELLGHKTLEMTMRYSHLTPAHKATAVEKLGAALEVPVPRSPTASPWRSAPRCLAERSRPRTWNISGPFSPGARRRRSGST